MSDDDCSTLSWRERFLAEARKLRGEREPVHRRGAFLLIKELLRADEKGNRPGPAPTRLEVLDAAYDQPDDYFSLFIDHDPRRAGTTHEEFLAVHAATTFDEFKRLQSTLTRNPLVRDIVFDPHDPSARNRLHRLLNDVDGGYLIGPELADHLRRTSTPEPITPVPETPQAAPESATTTPKAPQAVPEPVTPAPMPETAKTAVALLVEATNEHIDTMLRQLWKQRTVMRLGLRRDGKQGAAGQWENALAAQGLKSTWRAVRARYEHKDNSYLRGNPGRSTPD